MSRTWFGNGEMFSIIVEGSFRVKKTLEANGGEGYLGG
jgi:hypothetical protein